MNVTPPAPMPIFTPAAHMIADAGANTGFGDLLSALGASIGEGQGLLAAPAAPEAEVVAAAPLSSEVAFSPPVTVAAVTAAFPAGVSLVPAQPAPTFVKGGAGVEGAEPMRTESESAAAAPSPPIAPSAIAAPPPVASNKGHVVAQTGSHEPQGPVALPDEQVEVASAAAHVDLGKATSQMAVLAPAATVRIGPALSAAASAEKRSLASPAFVDRDADEPVGNGAAVERVDRPVVRYRFRSSEPSTRDASAPASMPANPQSLPIAAIAPVADRTAPQSGQTSVETASTSPVTAAPHPVEVGDAQTAAATGQDNLPALLATQTPAVAFARSAPSGQPYPATAHVPAQPVVAAATGRIGRDMGVEIARQISAGRQDVLVRLDPAEMGRIDVRLSFDDKGGLHTTMSADSATALDLLRRDVADLSRALSDAGIRADVSSFRFDSRGGEGGQFAQQQHQGQRDHHGGARRGRDDGDLADLSVPYRQLRTSGRVDLTA